MLVIFVIKDLWLSELNDNKNPNAENYKNLLLHIASEKATIYSLLPSDISKRIETLEEKETELRLSEEYTAFAKSFRLGAKVILDILVGCPTEK